MGLNSQFYKVQSSIAKENKRIEYLFSILNLGIFLLLKVPSALSCLSTRIILSEQPFLALMSTARNDKSDRDCENFLQTWNVKICKGRLLAKILELKKDPQRGNCINPSFFLLLFFRFALFVRIIVSKQYIFTCSFICFEFILKQILTISSKLESF